MLILVSSNSPSQLVSVVWFIISKVISYTNPAVVVILNSIVAPPTVKGSISTSV